MTEKILLRIITFNNFIEEPKVSKRYHDVLLIRLVRLVKTKFYYHDNHTAPLSWLSASAKPMVGNECNAP